MFIKNMALQRFQQSAKAKFNFFTPISLNKIFLCLNLFTYKPQSNIKQILTSKVLFYTNNQNTRKNLLLNLQT